MHKASATLFDVHRWIIPATTCDYPVLAVAQDGSALLSLGGYTLSFDWGIPEEAQPWLMEDFAPCGQTMRCDLGRVRSVLASTFPGGAEFGILHFDEAMRPTRLGLGLAVQTDAEQEAEYLLHDPDKYLRYYRHPDRLLPVTAAEGAMLEVCVATFAELAAQYGALLCQPLPPRYHRTGRIAPDQDN